MADNLAADSDPHVLPYAPAWHRRLDGGPHVTGDAADRAAAESIMLSRLGRMGAR